MEINTLHPVFGAELIGVDVRNADQALIDTVEALMKEHGVLCIRGQDLTDEEHLAFARKFGPLELPGPKRDIPRRMAYGLYDASNLDINGEIVDPASLRAKFAKGNEIFHADSSFNDMPSKWSMLRGLIVPPEKGDTEFLDLRWVYRELPQAMKDRIEHLVAEHSFAASREKGGVKSEDADRIRQVMPGAMQPMVRIAPNGEKCLFVGSHAFRVEGMSEEEGRALIDELLAFASQPKYIYAHKWKQFDVLIWDNRCMLHRGTVFDYATYKRDLRRANINEYGEERSAIADNAHFGAQLTHSVAAQAEGKAPAPAS
jgi:alpha-ketoglutarate-dependent 2,4-dichlorophenoxyacetate dioxygenase